MNNLYVEQLTVTFDGFKALDIDIFEVQENELRVVIGPNGAGKTTLLDVLCGKTKPDSGHAVFGPMELTRLSEDEIVAAGVGRKFQTPSVFATRLDRRTRSGPPTAPMPRSLPRRMIRIDFLRRCTAKLRGSPQVKPAPCICRTRPRVT